MRLATLTRFPSCSPLEEDDVSVGSVQIGATLRFRDEKMSCSRATFASSRVSGTSSLPNKCLIDYRASVSLQPRLHRIYRVAVEFTSRRISKGSGDPHFTPSKHYIHVVTMHYIATACAVNPRKLRFQLRRAPNNRYSSS